GTASSGTVFSMNLDGTNYQVLHEFLANYFGTYDGADPEADLTIAGSKLYGTTEAGGSLGKGTVFSMNLDGSGYRVLHSFASSSLGSTVTPRKLTIVGSSLYGTTRYQNTVFSMNLDGSNYQILHSFSESDRVHGEYPAAGLTLIGSRLYGTTLAGGSLDD